MDRRKALKNIGTASALAFVPLSLIPQDRVNITYSFLPSKKNPKRLIVKGYTIKDGVYEYICEEVDLEAKVYDIEFEDYPVEIEYDLASEPEKDDKKWENGFMEDFNGEIKPWEN